MERKNEKKVENGQRAVNLYVPPSKLKLMADISGKDDPKTEEYQKLSWETLKKSLNGLINKVNTANIAFVVQEMFRENLIRGRGVLAQYLMRAQNASPLYTNIYAALLAVINTKFPRNGELLLVRLVHTFRNAFKRNDKHPCINSAKFIAHLINQNVAHELLALEILTLLLSNPTDDSVEVAINFMKQVGQKLQLVSPKGVNAVFERLRKILHEANVISKRVQYMIEVLFAIRKSEYKDFVSIEPDLDLVEEEDQITHFVRLQDGSSTEDHLNVFKFDENWEENEEKYRTIQREILDDDDETDDDSSGVSGESDSEESENESKANDIIDKTDENVKALRRSIYLVIQSSLDFEECAHKLLKMQIPTAQNYEFCAMILDCSAQQRAYEKFYGLLSQRFCQLRPDLMEQFMKLFKEQYDTCHRLDSVKLRNTAKLYAHLLFTDAILWTVMEVIVLTEETTTSSSRIFIKVLFNDLNEIMGAERLTHRLEEEMLQPYFTGLFPTENIRSIRFAINFFTAINLGFLTGKMRESLKLTQEKMNFEKETVQNMPTATPMHPILTRAVKNMENEREEKEASDSDSYTSTSNELEKSSASSEKRVRRKRGRRHSTSSGSGEVEKFRKTRRARKSSVSSESRASRASRTSSDEVHESRRRIHRRR